MKRSERSIRIRRSSREKDRSASVPKEAHFPDGEPEETAPRPRRRRKRHLWWRLLLVALLLVLGLLLWKNWDSLNPGSVWDWLTIQVTGGVKGAGYPYALEGSSVLSVAPSGKQLALLTDNALLLLNSTAGETARRPHAFAAPLMDTAGEYILLTESGGKRLRLETVHKTELELTAENDLVTAAVCETGSFAAVIRGTGSHMSEVVVYTKTGRERYRWYSSELLVTGVALSADGTQMAVCGITAAEGACESRLLIFQVGDASAQPLRFSGRELMLCAVRYADADTVVAVGDEALWTVRPEMGEKTEISYTSQQLVQFAVGDGRITTVTSGLGSTAGGLLTVRDRTGEVLYEETFSESFRDLSASETGVCLLTDRSLYVLDREGGKTVTSVSSDGIRVSAAFGKTAVLGLTEVRIY